jgi:hypothetical protein
MPKKNPILSPRLEGAAPSDRWALTRELEQAPPVTLEEAQLTVLSTDHVVGTHILATLPPSLGNREQKEKPLGGSSKKQAAKTQGQSMEAPGTVPMSANPGVYGARRGAVDGKGNPIPL